MNTQDQSAFKRLFTLPEFPQYPRLFSALPWSRLKSGIIKGMLWLTLITVIAINVRIMKPEPVRQLMRAMHIFSSESTPKNSDILGATNRNDSGESDQRAALQRQFDYWEHLLRSHDDYRDGHYMAALLAYQLNNMSAFTYHMERAKTLDPNASTLTSLEMLKQKN